ncbi:hypothetical protein FRC12_000285 [Ceratobasidium sp. 428]|nr:hypothetical protein FRC12_000285 [Ceratobasidium sp. 428]
MSEAESSRPKREIKKTKAIETHDSNVKKSQNTRESNQRNKNVREQEAALVAAENGLDESPKKPKSKKKKSKSKKAADADDGSKAPSPEPDATLLALKEDEAKARRLRGMLHFRDDVPWEILEQVDYEDLEGFVAAGDDAAKVLLTVGPHAKPPKAKPSKVAAKAPLPAKTPKRIAAIVEPATIKALGSPINALYSAKKQSALGADTPIAATRKRASSTDRGGPESKRQRKTALDGIKPPQPRHANHRSASGPASYASSSSLLKNRLQSGSRSSSRAPSASRAPSQAPAGPVSTSGPALGESDFEMLGQSDIDEPMAFEEPEEEKPKKKTRAPPGQAKERPRLGHYTGMERQLLEETLQIVCSRLGSQDACPLGGEFERLIRKSWAEAAKNLGTTTEKWPCDQDHVRVVSETEYEKPVLYSDTIVQTSDRVGSYRGHAKRNIRGPVAVAYGLDSMVGKDLTKHVEYLLEKRFYKGPKVDGRSGLFEHPLVIATCRQLYFIGRKSPAVRYPGEYNPLPPNALALALAILEFAISEYGGGEFKEQDLEFETLYKLWSAHLKNIKFWMDKVGEKVHVKVRTVLMNSGKTSTAAISNTNNKNLLTGSDFEDNSDEEELQLVLRPNPGHTAVPSSSKPGKASKLIPSSSKSGEASKSSKSKSIHSSSESTSASSEALNKSISSHKLKPKPKPKAKPRLELSVVMETPSSSPAKPPPSKPSLSPSKPAAPAAMSNKPRSVDGSKSTPDDSSSSSSSESSNSSDSESSSSGSSDSESSDSESGGAKSGGTKSKPASDAAATEKPTSPAPKTAQPSRADKGAKKVASGNPIPGDSAGVSKDSSDSSDSSGLSEPEDADTGKGPKPGEELMDVDVDEGAGGASERDNAATKPAPANEASDKKSSSARPNAGDPAEEKDEAAEEVEAKEVKEAEAKQTKEKEKKGKGKKGKKGTESKGKEKDPGKNGTKAGVMTRSARKSA